MNVFNLRNCKENILKWLTENGLNQDTFFTDEIWQNFFIIFFFHKMQVWLNLACYKNDKLHFSEFIQKIHFLKNLSNHIEDVYFWNTRKRRLMSACPVQFYTKDVRCFLPQKRFDTEKRDMEVDLPSPPFFRKSTYIYMLPSVYKLRQFTNCRTLS